MKSIYNAGIEGSKLTSEFFREEYQLNHRIALQHQHQGNTIPQVSIWDGIVMGGGVGLSVHGKYRVATENTVFAKPETNIGFFPDVGATYALPRININGTTDHGVANYIALTGARLKADDLLYTGLATHYIPSERVDDAIKAIVEASMNTDITGDCAAGPLMAHHERIPKNESFLARHRQWIDDAFQDKTNVEDIIIALERQQEQGNKSPQTHHKDQVNFATHTLQTLHKMSPTSLKITLESLIRGKALPTIADCLKMEYRMSQVSVKKGSDMYEGLRAILIDKDQNPKWNPASLEDVEDDIVKSFFESLGDDDLVLGSEDDGSGGMVMTSKF